MDTPMHGKRVLIMIDRRRFRCKSCGKTVFEPLPDMDGKRQATSRLIEYIERRCLRETFAALSREVGVDDKTIRFIFDDYAARKEQELEFKTPSVLGIDELKIVGSYRAMLTNIDKLAMFDLLPSRKQQSLMEYFYALPDKGNVETVVMDMWNPYRRVARTVFPGRLIVADRFHVTRMANEGMERVRKQIRKDLDDKTRIKLKDERFLLYKRSKDLTSEDWERVNQWFAMFPALGSAYRAKEEFFDTYEQPTRAAAERHAVKWASLLDPAISRHFRDLRVAVHNWHEEIFNYYENPVTNGYTESMNNIARFINRMGRGYSFEVLRARLLFDEKVVKSERPTIRKKVRKQKPSGDAWAFSVGRTIATSCDNFEYRDVLGPVVNYGADLSILAQLLEDGYFS
jgi:transposase